MAAAGVQNTVWAVADLHASVLPNKKMLDRVQPSSVGDWLIVAGDVAERPEVTLRVLELLAHRFAQVIWCPGNHELFCRGDDTHRGKDRYELLVQGCREIGVATPEYPYLSFDGVTIVPLFTLYDYSWRLQGLSVEEALAQAKRRQIVMTDEYTIAPFVDIRAWCWDRLAYSVRRLATVTGPTILVNHWPLVREPTTRLRWSEIGLWGGTRHTQGWPLRYRARAVIYGHLHVPGCIWVDGVPHYEVSLGYPRQWREYPEQWQWPLPILGQGQVKHGGIC